MKKFTICLEPTCDELTVNDWAYFCPWHAGRPYGHHRCVKCKALKYGMSRLCYPCSYVAKQEYYQQLKEEWARKQEELDAYRSLGSIPDLIDKICRLEILLHAEELQLEG